MNFDRSARLSRCRLSARRTAANNAWSAYEHEKQTPRSYVFQVSPTGTTHGSVDFQRSITRVASAVMMSLRNGARLPNCSAVRSPPFVRYLRFSNLAPFLNDIITAEAT